MGALADRDYFTDYEVLNRPYSYFDAVRERGPVYVVPETGVVIVVGYDEALKVLGDKRPIFSGNHRRGGGRGLAFRTRRR
jgi:cytochrome P450